jgi:hypothetical protein
LTAELASADLEGAAAELVHGMGMAVWVCVMAGLILSFVLQFSPFLLFQFFIAVAGFDGGREAEMVAVTKHGQIWLGVSKFAGMPWMGCGLG